MVTYNTSSSSSYHLTLAIRATSYYLHNFATSSGNSTTSLYLFFKFERDDKSYDECEVNVNDERSMNLYIYPSYHFDRIMEHQWRKTRRKIKQVAQWVSKVASAVETLSTSPTQKPFNTRLLFLSRPKTPCNPRTPDRFRQLQ